MNSQQRIEHLRQYLNGCVKAGLLTKEDLLSGEIIHKLAAVISRDMRVIGKEIAAQGIAKLASVGVMKIMGLAEKFKGG